MPSLGLFMMWAGYTLGIWGFSKYKTARAPAFKSSLSDLVLPSHRQAYLLAAFYWTNQQVAAGTGVGGGTLPIPNQGSGPNATGYLGAGVGPTDITPIKPGQPVKTQGGGPGE